MVGIFYVLLGNVLFGATIDDDEPNIVTSNKMANDVWEVNLRCLVFHLPLLNYNFNS